MTDRNRDKKEPAGGALLDVKDLRRELGIGRDASYTLAHTLGRRVGRKLIVVRSELVAWLLERDQPATGGER